MARFPFGLGCLALLTLAAGPATAADAEPAAFTAFAPAPAAPLPAASASPEAVLPLREALQLALRHNLDVELARGERASSGAALAQARGAFDPVASMGSGWTRSSAAQSGLAASAPGDARLPLAAGGGGERSELEQSAGVTGVLPLGLRYASSYSLSRAQTRGAGVASAADRGRVFEAQLTLPLLRDLRMNEPRARLLRGELDEQAAGHGFEARLAELVASVETLYWNLAAARAEVRVAERSLDTARALEQQTRAQEELGLAARVLVRQAQAGVAERELGAIRATNGAARARDQLLSAILAPGTDIYTERELQPEVPTFSPYAVQLAEATATALRLRPELAAARRQLEAAQLDADLAQNQLRPRLDLSANYRADDRAAAERDADEPGRGDATGGESASRGRGLGLTARFEMPLGNRSARARAEQGAIGVRRARTELRRLEQSVILDVRGAVGELESAEQAVRAAERRRAATADVLLGEQERVQLGELTPYQVLEADAAVADAERQWIAALRDHRVAIARVEQVQGRLLETRGLDAESALQR